MSEGQERRGRVSGPCALLGKPDRRIVPRTHSSSGSVLPTAWMALALAFLTGISFPVAHAQSIARVWDEEILAAIRIDLPHPPVHARNLFHLSAVMYDAWAAYDSRAVGFLYRGKHVAANVEMARREAISYAAYRLLMERYALSRNAKVTLAALGERMAALGYDTNNASTDVAVPAGLGNRIALELSAFVLNDGSLQGRAYQDWPVLEGGYSAVNPPLITGARGTLAVNVNRWQPLVITNATSQNNIPVDLIQKFQGAQWLAVRPFSLTRSDPSRPWFDPGPPPYLGGTGDAQFRAEMADILRRSSQLSTDDGAVMDVSPGAIGNNPLGSNDGIGHPINPATGQPYPANVVRRGDFARVLAEFWADGPNSETPPGHWNTIANHVTDQLGDETRLGGTGPTVDALEWEVKLYFALNAAVHDAACAAWSLKRYYDGYRPIAGIRFMGQLGQSSDPSAPAYHQNGLPLIPGLIELVTPSSSLPGQRHFGLPVNAMAVLAWPGEPENPLTQQSGVRWVLADNWFPYQRKTFVTPAFPGYVSGHSTFSRAAAEVLAAFTGSPFFPGGLSSYTVSKLTFEAGPSAPVVLQWATYFDAADQAGLSRLWGGIHVSVDDLTGRRLGALCGQSVWALAHRYFDGSIADESTPITISFAYDGLLRINCQTVRGFFYRFQVSRDLSLGFVDEPGAAAQALDSDMARFYRPSGGAEFFRVVSSPVP